MRPPAPLLLAALLLAAPARAATDPSQVRAFSLHNTAVSGSAKAVALSGALVAYPDEYTAVFINPAGLGGLTGTGIDFGSDSNSVRDFVVDLDDPRSRSISVPIRYAYYGVRYIHDGSWGLGLVAQTPFAESSTFLNQTTRRRGQVNVTGDETELGVDARTYTLAGAKSFFDGRLSVGAAVDYNRVEESYAFRPVHMTTAPYSETLRASAWSADFGVIAKPKDWLYLGAVYRLGWLADFPEERNVGLPYSNIAFRDARAPHSLTFGLAWIPAKPFRLYLQSQYVYALKNTVVIGSGLSTANSAVVTEGQYDAWNGYWGAEFIPLDVSDLTIKLWAGGYLENTGLQGGYRRYHKTAGFGFNPWFLTVSLAIDDAELYQNLSAGLGVDILALADRTAKRLGKKLPL